MIRRRELIALLGGVAAAWPLAARAQTGARRVAALFPLAASDPEQAARRDAVQHGLERLGWIAGRTVQFDFRFAGRPERLALLARELVAAKPDVIFAQTSAAVDAVLLETRTIPIVFANVSDPIGPGYVASLARPGGNITGMQNLEASIAGKWLSMLKEVAPGVKRATLMANPKTSAFE